VGGLAIYAGASVGTGVGRVSRGARGEKAIVGGNQSFWRESERIWRRMVERIRGSVVDNDCPCRGGRVRLRQGSTVTAVVYGRRGSRLVGPGLDDDKRPHDGPPRTAGAVRADAIMRRACDRGRACWPRNRGWRGGIRRARRDP